MFLGFGPNALPVFQSNFGGAIDQQSRIHQRFAEFHRLARGQMIGTAKFNRVLRHLRGLFFIVKKLLGGNMCD